MIREFDVLNNLEYVKTGGSKEELQAANYIAEVLASFGLSSTLESFKVNGEEITEQSLEVTKPYHKVIPCKGYFGSGECENLTKEFYYLRDTTDVSFAGVKDKIVYVDGYLRHWLYKDIFDKGAAGFIVANGSLFVENNDIDQRELRDGQRAIGIIPGVQVNSKDIYEMVQKGATEVKMTLKQHPVDKVSQNVVARIEGEDSDVIVFSAHYDSTWLSKGSNDNATGAVALIKIAEYFMNHKPRHTLVFVWCGSEERGLLGSKAFVKQHSEELDNYKFNINIDMIGETMGRLIAQCTSELDLLGYLNYFAKEMGSSIVTNQMVASTDSTPFADAGIPAVAFNRSSAMQPIHERYDDMSQLSEEVLKADINLILEFTKRMANSAIIPVKRVIPDNLKEELDIYLLRKRKD